MVVGAGLGCLAVGDLVDPVDRFVRQEEPGRPTVSNPPGVSRGHASCLSDLHNEVRRYNVAVVGDQYSRDSSRSFGHHASMLMSALSTEHLCGAEAVPRWLVATVIRCQAERVASADGVYARIFQRHAHPFRAWSRLLSTPLLWVPLWTRRWWLYGPIGAWFAVNPVITPPVHDTSSFAARAILGEESWSRKPTSEPVVLALSGVASASLVGAMVAAYQRRKAGAVIGTGVFMALTLWEWKLWADRFARERRRTGA